MEFENNNIINLVFILGAVDVGSVLMNKTYFSNLWYNS